MSLIKNNNTLDTEVFKHEYANYTWYKVPRVLTQDHQDYFYIVKSDDTNSALKIVIRPSKMMAITETNKNCDINGNTLEENSTKKKFEFSKYVEVKVGEKLLKEIDSISVNVENLQIQKVEI